MSGEGGEIAAEVGLALFESGASIASTLRLVTSGGGDEWSPSLASEDVDIELVPVKLSFKDRANNLIQENSEKFLCLPPVGKEPQTSSQIALGVRASNVQASTPFVEIQYVEVTRFGDTPVLYAIWVW